MKMNCLYKYVLSISFVFSVSISLCQSTPDPLYGKFIYWQVKSGEITGHGMSSKIPPIEEWDFFECYIYLDSNLNVLKASRTVDFQNKNDFNLTTPDTNNTVVAEYFGMFEEKDSSLFNCDSLYAGSGEIIGDTLIITYDNLIIQQISIYNKTQPIIEEKSEVVITEMYIIKLKEEGFSLEKVLDSETNRVEFKKTGINK